MINKMRSYTERMERGKEKILNVLTFLKEETYSDKASLMQVSGITNSGNFYRFIEKLVQHNFLQRFVFEVPGTRITLWGITMDGIAVVLQPDDVFPNRFEPSKLTGWSLQHHIMNQNIRLTLEAKGGHSWINGDRKSFMTQFDVKHRPDGLITLPDGQRIAIEAERSLKTKARYQEIMKSHLVARKADKWQYVYYVLPDEQKKLALMKLFGSITFLTFSGRPITLEQGHREVFKFFTVEELKNQSFS